MVLLVSSLILVASASIAPSAGATAASPPSSRPGNGNGGWVLPPSVLDHPRGMIPRKGSSLTPRVGTAPGSANPHCPPCSPPLLFTVGRPVMGTPSSIPGHVTITPYYWAPSGYVYTANYKTIINGYLADVAAASGTNTNVFSVSTQYYEQASPSSPVQHIEYVIQAGAEVDDTTAFPAQNMSPGCVADSGFSACISDGDLHAELLAELTALSRPLDDSHLYMVFFPQAVETCAIAGSSASSPCSTNVYCAYHSGFASGPNLVFYGNEPFPDPTHCPSGQAPNGDAAADSQVSLISHEANESITDAGGAWMDSAGFENGDECAFTFGLPLGSTGGPGTAYNQVIGTGKYYTQDEFSNEDFSHGFGDVTVPGGTFVNGCVQREELPTAWFTRSGSFEAGASDSFDASGSSDLDSNGALTFSWSWGDGTGNGTGVAPSHIFASAGTFMVTMTVTDADGWSASLSTSVVVTPCVAPAVSGVFPTTGSTAGGTLVQINGANLREATAVKFGASTAAGYTITDGTQIVATSPPGSGAVDITVTTICGTSAVSSADQYTYVTPPVLTYYFQWFDLASPGMVGDNIHLLNLGTSTANITATMPGASPIIASLPAGAETHVTFGPGHIGGPVVVTADQPILASQRVQYFQSFNEVWAMTAAQATKVSYIQWFDRASPGMVGDNIHVLNPGSMTANVTISLPGATPISFGLAAGAEHYATFPPGHIGGPVTVTADVPVLASSRVQYYQTFNEVVARSATQATTTSYFNWFDRATGGMVGDNIHLLNPGSSTAHITVSLAGATTINVTLVAGAESYATFPAGHIGGPVTVTSDVPVLASQRVQYFQSFNETPAASAAQAQTTSHVMWFDLASPGMVGDNIHILDLGANANIAVSLPGASTIYFTLRTGAETYVSFPVGHIGGPVTIISDQPVLAAQRVQYYQTFNEVPAA